jgi:hypothetical protein
MIADTASLSDTVGFELVGADLGKDVQRALKTALASGAVLPYANKPMSIFREALAISIRDIQSHPKGRLFQEFLLKGPYEDRGRIPKVLVDKRLSDIDTASVITFIYAYMVNCFKGGITELLASGACVRLLQQLQRSGSIPHSARVFVGDAVTVRRPRGKGDLKGADMHLLVVDHSQRSAKRVTVAGVVEVKSYFPSQRSLREQLDQHVKRTMNGLKVAGDEYSSEAVHVGLGTTRRVVKIAVVPSGWLLPRTFRFKRSKHGRVLQVDPGFPDWSEDEIAPTGEDEWRITLRWSKEALAAAAYEMTFWYMEKVGEVIYSRGVPKEWGEMSPAEAGRNAAKMMLYYAIRRCRKKREKRRAIALYNSYGFGYALGMNFKNSQGRREMLWPEDLDEILSTGETKNGCRIH